MAAKKKGGSRRTVKVDIATGAAAAAAARRTPSGKRAPKKGDYRHERGGKFARGGDG